MTVTDGEWLEFPEADDPYLAAALDLLGGSAEPGTSAEPGASPVREAAAQPVARSDPDRQRTCGLTAGTGLMGAHGARPAGRWARCRLPHPWPSRQILGRADPEIIGVVLSGSAARGWPPSIRRGRLRGPGRRPTASDEVLRSAAVDEIPVTLSKLERPAPFGSDGWWHRWSFAWAQVLRDDTGGRVAAAVHRQATLTPEEQDVVLAARLDGNHPPRRPGAEG